MSTLLVLHSQITYECVTVGRLSQEPSHFSHVIVKISEGYKAKSFNKYVPRKADEKRILSPKISTEKCPLWVNANFYDTTYFLANQTTLVHNVHETFRG